MSPVVGDDYIRSPSSSSKLKKNTVTEDILLKESHTTSKITSKMDGFSYN